MRREIRLPMVIGFALAAAAAASPIIDVTITGYLWQ